MRGPIYKGSMQEAASGWVFVETASFSVLSGKYGTHPCEVIAARQVPFSAILPTIHCSLCSHWSASETVSLLNVPFHSVAPQRPRTLIYTVGRLV